MLETVGLDWRMLDQYVERVRAVSAEQVQAVAKKYLTESNMTVTLLEPQPGVARPRASQPMGDRHVR
jgi:zinc protease